MLPFPDVPVSYFRLSILLILLSGCVASPRQAATDWPETLPPSSYFVKAYEGDRRNHEYQSLDEYLHWVRRFYEGTTLHPRGWNDITAEILEESDGAATAARKRRLYKLGRDIAAEWAKASRINRVDNRHLAVWGIAAGRAIEENNIEETLDSITADLEGLLSQRLAPDDITAGRYHEQDPDDWFAL